MLLNLGLRKLVKTCYNVLEGVLPLTPSLPLRLIFNLSVGVWVYNPQVKLREEKGRLTCHEGVRVMGPSYCVKMGRM